jgi:hypothetical protein
VQVTLGSVRTLLLELQDCIDYDKTVQIMNEKKIVNFFIEQMRKETENCNGDTNDPGTRPDTSKSARGRVPQYGKRADDGQRYYAKYPRQRLLIEIINYSVANDDYHVTYEIIRVFLSDLLKIKDLPIFAEFFRKMRNTQRYEAKIETCLAAIPLMKKDDAFRLMRIFIQIVDEPPQNSVLHNNINPLRVGLMLFRLITEISTTFEYSEHTTLSILDKLKGQMVTMLDIYIQPHEVMRMCEALDYDGHNLFWYMDMYDMYEVLDSRILDRIIQTKWNGKYDLNASFLDYSTGYAILNDSHDLFCGDQVFHEIRYTMLRLDRSDLVHKFKFEVWKHSM